MRPLGGCHLLAEPRVLPRPLLLLRHVLGLPVAVQITEPGRHGRPVVGLVVWRILLIFLIGPEGSERLAEPAAAEIAQHTEASQLAGGMEQDQVGAAVAVHVAQLGEWIAPHQGIAFALEVVEGKADPRGRRGLEAPSSGQIAAQVHRDPFRRGEEDVGPLVAVDVVHQAQIGKERAGAGEDGPLAEHRLPGQLGRTGGARRGSRFHAQHREPVVGHRHDRQPGRAGLDREDRRVDRQCHRPGAEAAVGPAGEDPDLAALHERGNDGQDLDEPLDVVHRDRLLDLDLAPPRVGDHDGKIPLPVAVHVRGHDGRRRAGQGEGKIAKRELLPRRGGREGRGEEKEEEGQEGGKGRTDRSLDHA
jgi:hypothetical protein